MMRAIDISINTSNNILDSPNLLVPKLMYSSANKLARAIDKGSIGLGHIRIRTPKATNAPYHILYAIMDGMYESTQANTPPFLNDTAALSNLIVLGYMK